MNKKLLALAVAGIMAAPMAANAASDTVLYGSARIDLQSVETKSGGTKTEDEWDIKDQFSRLGVKGAEDLGGGLSAIYNMEFGIDLADQGTPSSSRPHYVGLKGGFGQVTIGNQWSPYYVYAMAPTDIFNSVGGGKKFSAGGTFGAGAKTIGYKANNRAPSTIAYGNSVGGVSFAVAAVIDSNDDTTVNDKRESGIDAIHAGVKIPAGPVNVGIAMVDDSGVTGNTETSNATGVSVTWKSGNIMVGGTFETGENKVTGGSKTEMESLSILAQFTAGNNIFYGAFEDGEDETAGAKDKEREAFAVGFQHNLSKRTRLWAEYGTDEVKTVPGGSKTENTVMSFGIRHDF